MISNKKIKIWTIITHALIVVGAGHGFFFLFILEILQFPYITKDSFRFSFNGLDNHFAMVGFAALLGQIALLLSLFNRKQNIKNLFQWIGLILLWLSLLYFIYDSIRDSYTHIAIITAIPFGICTVITIILQIRKNYTKKLSPKHSLQRLVDYMPAYYHEHRQFINCIEFLKNREWGLAVQSLIELADETGHYFSEEFWTELAQVSDNMHLNIEADYCREQIIRNAADIKHKTPFGWTTVKFDDTHFQHHISEKLKEEWAEQRREKDNVSALLMSEGVHLKWNGRSGFLYITEKGRIAEVEYELGGNGYILYFNKLAEWTLPTKHPLVADDKQKIKDDIINWALKTNNAIEFS